MATKSETHLQQRIAKAIRQKYGADAWVMKIHGGPYQRAGVPDLLVIREGRAFWLEVKMDDEQPTAIQRQVMAELRGVGCVVEVVRSVSDAIDSLEA